MSGIYIILNQENGKYYLGSAVNLQSRWRVHKHHLKNNKHHSQHLQRAWNKYGEKRFEFIPVLKVEREKLLSTEQLLLDTLKPFDGERGYNVSEVASGVGLSGKKNPNYGKPMPIDQRRRISKSLMGHSVSEETRRRISQNTSRKYGADNHNYGVLVSEERKRAQSEKMTGRFVGEKNPFYGKKHTAEARRKMSEAKIGRTGERCPNSKPVEQYSKDMVLLAAHCSATEAMRVTNINNANISACCNGRLKRAGGFIWRYADEQERVSE